jgi:glycerol 2-dehydrogenase (NADP+)
MGAPADVLTHQLFKDIAASHGCSPAVVSLSWAVQRGVSVIPKSSNTERMEDNIKLVTLTDDEMAKMNSAHETITKYRIADYIPQLQATVDGKQTILGWTPVELGWEDEQGNWLA